MTSSSLKRKTRSLRNSKKFMQTSTLKAFTQKTRSNALTKDQKDLENGSSLKVCPRNGIRVKWMKRLAIEMGGGFRFSIAR
jgi:hypothetical protein